MNKKLYKRIKKKAPTFVKKDEKMKLKWIYNI